MIYKNCRELPIHNFFEINRTNDLNYLVKSGKKPSKEILEEKLLEIIDEYNSLFSSKKASGMANNAKLYMLNIKLMNLEIVDMILSSSGITDEIRAVAKRLRIKPENIPAYVSGVKNDIQRLQREMDSHAVDEEEQKQSNGDALEKTLTLVKENGFNFDRFKTPIIEFVYAINRLEEKTRQLENSK